MLMLFALLLRLLSWLRYSLLSWSFKVDSIRHITLLWKNLLECTLKLHTGSPSERAHTLQIPSSDADTTKSPWCANCKTVTGDVWPSRSCEGSPVLRAHNFNRPPFEPIEKKRKQDKVASVERKKTTEHLYTVMEMLWRGMTEQGSDLA